MFYSVTLYVYKNIIIFLLTALFMFLFQTDCFHEVFSLIPVLWWRMCSLCFLLEPARGSYSIFCVSCMDGLIPFKNAWPTLASVFILVSMLSGEDTLCLLVSMLSVEDTVCILVSTERFHFQGEVTRLRPCWFGDTMVCFLWDQTGGELDCNML